jgi:hypothetical protein
MNEGNLAGGGRLEREKEPRFSASKSIHHNFLGMRKYLLTGRLKYVPEFYFSDSKLPSTEPDKHIITQFKIL